VAAGNDFGASLCPFTHPIHYYYHHSSVKITILCQPHLNPQGNLRDSIKSNSELEIISMARFKQKEDARNAQSASLGLTGFWPLQI